MKKIVVKCHTPFTLMISSMIIESAFSDYNKILIWSGDVGVSFISRLCECKIFDEICSFDESVTTITDVEKQVDEFLVNHDKIDWLLISVFSDRFGPLLIEKLANIARIGCYPEGSSCFNLKETIDLVFDKVYSHDEKIALFYKKHPILLEAITDIWTLQDKFIWINDITSMHRIDMTIMSEKLLYKLNILFNYDDVSLKDDSNIYYIDDPLVENNRLLAEAELLILDRIFNMYSDFIINVKLHPGQNIRIGRAKFSRYANSCVILPHNIPWELILLNQNAKQHYKYNEKKVTMICPFFSTTFISAVEICDSQYKVEFISLNKILYTYASDYIKSTLPGVKEKIDYIKKHYNNVEILEPEHIIDVDTLIETKKNVKENYALLEDGQLSSRYFAMVGNVFDQTTIFINCDKKRIDSLVYFLQQSTTWLYVIDELMEIFHIKWMPSELNMINLISDFQIILFDYEGGNNVAVHYDEIFIPPSGCLEFDIVGERQCNKVLMTGVVESRYRYRNLIKEQYFNKAVIKLWYKWTFISDCAIRQYLSENGIIKVWIFGDGELGLGIYEKFRTVVDDLKLVTSNKKINNDGQPYRYSLKELQSINTKVDLIIITTRARLEKRYFFKFDQEPCEVTHVFDLCDLLLRS